MSEFGEPWRVIDSANWGCSMILHEEIDSATGIVTMGGHAPSAPTRDQMDRIVACVNFLAGVPTEDLELIRKYGDLGATISGTIRDCARGIREQNWAPERLMSPAAEVENKYGLPPGYLTGTAADAKAIREAPDSGTAEVNTSVAENSQGGQDARPAVGPNDPHSAGADASAADQA